MRKKKCLRWSDPMGTHHVTYPAYLFPADEIIHENANFAPKMII